MRSKHKWRKIGRIFCPTGEFPWMQSHAAVPIAENVGGSLFKIYFSSRDDANRSFTGYVIVDIERPHQILEISDTPVLVPGNLGEFDDSGAMATWLTQYQGKKFLYYIGWNLGVTVPFRNSIGLAISARGEPYQRYASGPILDRSPQEPHFCASCCVLPDQDCWRMWYVSCTGWRMRAGVPEHQYHIKYAESRNGIDWQRNGHIAIDYANDREYAISRPSVLRGSDRWRMWYSYRGSSYRIGYAESDDGRLWQRHDQQVGIDVATTGWDSDMIEYPFVFDHQGQRFLLYNGNAYGGSGFGLALLEDKS